MATRRGQASWKGLTFDAVALAVRDAVVLASLHAASMRLVHAALDGSGQATEGEKSTDGFHCCWFSALLLLFLLGAAREETCESENERIAKRAAC